MLLLTPVERRDLRARAHRLQPVVSVGQQGLTESVLHEIDVNLRAHELIKVRVFNADHEAREAVLARICAALEAAPVQHIGKLLVLWRPAPEESVPLARAAKPRGHRERHPASAARAGDRARRAPPRGGASTAVSAAKVKSQARRAPPRSGASAAVSAAKSKPQARRPREPAPRTPARPPAARGRRTGGEPPAAGGRRRRGRVQGP